jgi:predicted ribosome quality control (RQC) complex YloA/Tae2 family protein
MYVDAITLAAVADEWGVLLAGARIDTIIQPTEYALALQCYVPGSPERGGQNRWLYLSAHPQFARAHLTALKPPKIASEPPAFVMLLRKHLEGTRIETVLQPRWERVLEIVSGYRSGPEGNERVRFRLIIEMMGRLSNIILCNNDGLILGSLKRVGSDINRYRVIAAGAQYVPPPPQQRAVADQTQPRLEPTSITAAQLSLAAAAERATDGEQTSRQQGKKRQEQTRLWQFVNRQLQGCSPLLAREVVYRTTEESETPLANATDELWEELAWNIRELSAIYDTHRWQPQLVERLPEGAQATSTGNAGQPLAFAPYVLEQYARQPGLHVRRSP